jgi:signal transduction histidine kinase
LNNACKYTPPESKITLSAQVARDASNGKVEVSNGKVEEREVNQENGSSRGGYEPLHCSSVQAPATVRASSPRCPQGVASRHSQGSALEGCLRLSVSNSGIEIPVEEYHRIFDKFYRIPSSDPWKHGGTGLGLALVKGLVERLQGTITVESAEGQTTFTVELPFVGSEPD